MLFEDQVEQLKEYSESVASRIQESSLFGNLQERYASLSPSFQKILIASSAFLIVLLVLAGPIANYKASVENMASFEERKGLTSQIIDYAKKTKSSTPQPKQYNVGSLSREVKTLAGSYSINFLPEQTSVSTSASEKKLVLGAEQNNFAVKANKANIDQVATLTYSLQKLNKSLLITGIEFKANKEDPSYFDSSIEVANLYVRSASEILPKPEPEKKKGRSKRGRR